MRIINIQKNTTMQGFFKQMFCKITDKIFVQNFPFESYTMWFDSPPPKSPAHLSNDELIIGKSYSSKQKTVEFIIGKN